MDDDDLQIDNILDHHKKKPKVDGKAKGDRTELILCKSLSKHFGAEFSRALGSGSRWSQVGNLPEHAKKTLSGDICVPEHFKWVIECKGGYKDEMNLNNIVDGPLTCLDTFIEQTTRDSEYAGRKPIILWKRNRKPWLAILRHQDIIEKSFTYIICYREWRIVKLDDLLECTDRAFWFEESKT